MPYPSLYSDNDGNLTIAGSVADAAELPASGATGSVQITRDDGHAHLWDGDDWIDLGPVAVAVLPLPLYAITGYTAALPAGETIIGTYASMAALLADVPPTAQGERIQAAGAPTTIDIGIYEGRYIAGSWAWLEV